jgi:hypothetical protein
VRTVQELLLEVAAANALLPGGAAAYLAQVLANVPIGTPGQRGLAIARLAAGQGPPPGWPPRPGRGGPPPRP